jgi:signal transduction histidine kinase
MPTLTIELDNQTVQQLKQLEARHGETAKRLAAQLLAQTVAERTAANAVPLSQLSEAELLQRIGEGWEEARWNRYFRLVEKRKADMLTAKEYGELSRLTDARELLNAERLTFLTELAHRRNVPLRTLMTQLGIGNTLDG